MWLLHTSLQELFLLQGLCGNDTQSLKMGSLELNAILPVDALPRQGWHTIVLSKIITQDSNNHDQGQESSRCHIAKFGKRGVSFWKGQ